ncbi:hypothetical protein TURU_091834 [Turdus rufiventris]|nr:hypothetical protein TURU_091834 [Turdus rufiventris]
MDEEVMKTWLMKVYAPRRERFFNLKVPGLLIFDSMCAHKTHSMKALVKKMNSELAVILGGLTKEVQPLDISVIRSFKAKLLACQKEPGWISRTEISDDDDDDDNDDDDDGDDDDDCSKILC